MPQSIDIPPVVTAADRKRMRRLATWKAGLPPVSAPPPRTLKQVFEINEELRRKAPKETPNDALAFERLVRFRTRLLRLQSDTPIPPPSGER